MIERLINRLGQLRDVSTVGVQEGDVLVYDTGSAKFVPGTLPAGESPGLSYALFSADSVALGDDTQTVVSGFSRSSGTDDITLNADTQTVEVTVDGLYHIQTRVTLPNGGQTSASANPSVGSLAGGSPYANATFTEVSYGVLARLGPSTLASFVVTVEQFGATGLVADNVMVDVNRLA